MLITLLLAAVLTPTADDVPGRYAAEGDDAACQITLRPAAAQLPESHVTGEAASGFAFAPPGCPANLSDAAFWRLSLADGALSVVDGAGETLFSGAAEGASWTGAAPGGEQLRLHRR